MLILTKKWMGCFLMLLAILSLCGCLNQEDRESAERLNWQLERMLGDISQHRAEYLRFTDKIEFKPFEGIAKRESWQKQFDKAQTKVLKFQESYQKNIAPILKADKKEQGKDLQVFVKGIRSKLPEVKEMYLLPTKRMQAISAVLKDPSMYYRNTILSRFESTRDDFQKSQNLYEDKTITNEKSKEMLEKDFLALEKMFVETEKMIKALRPSSKNVLDCANLIDTSLSFDNLSKEFKQKNLSFQNELSYLDKSVVKLVSDFKQVAFVEIVRVSWNASSDSDTEHTYFYSPRKVSDEAYDYFTQLKPDKTLVSHGEKLFSSDFETSIKINAGFWSELGIDPHEEWPITTSDSKKLSQYGITKATGVIFGGDNKYEVQTLMEEKGLVWPQRGCSQNSSGFWLNDAYKESYVLVDTIIDGTRVKSEWLAYDSEEAQDFEPNLGMAIYSKAPGEVSGLAEEEAMPPGMHLVGDKRTGEWRTDPETGNSFWYYYGHYAVFNNLLGSSRIYRSEHDEWRKKYHGAYAYYGSTGSGGQKYGTNGRVVRTSGRYQKTSFARHGGLRSPVASAKNISMRGGGPGSKGK